MDQALLYLSVNQQLPCVLLPVGSAAVATAMAMASKVTMYKVETSTGFLCLHSKHYVVGQRMTKREFGVLVPLLLLM
jgi:hypothetical protein